MPGCRCRLAGKEVPKMTNHAKRIESLLRIAGGVLAGLLALTIPVVLTVAMVVLCALTLRHFGFIN